MQVKENKKRTARDIFTLFAICFMGYGVRLFDGQANVFLFIILLVNGKELKHIPTKYIFRLAVVTVCGFLFFYIKGMTLELWIIRAWVTGAFICCIYRNRINDFAKNFSKLAYYSAVYTLLHIPVYLLFGVYPFKAGLHTFFLFWYNTADTFLGIPRIQGFAWEPSCWSYILIINLIFCLYKKENKKKLIVALLAILFCNSTTVLMSTAVILAVHSYFIVKKNKLVIPLIVLIGILVFPFFQGKLNGKLSSGSGLARLSDFYILADVIKTSPILGADAYNVSNSSLAYNARVIALIDSGLNESEVGAKSYYGEEMVNDFAALLVEWGVILGPLILYLYLLTPLLKGLELKVLVLAGTIAVLTGTPITRTPIFFLFPISVLIMNPKLILHPMRNMRSGVNGDKNR